MGEKACRRGMPRLLEFPQGFLWGTATSAYQVEGGWTEGNKGRSIWDYFSHTQGKVLNMENGDMADDHYHRFEEDVRLMASMGLKNYRMSIAWTRIQPTGTGPANPDGVAFYNRIFDALIEAGIEPMVTLYHWDLPLELQVERDGWLGGQFIIDAFVEYARLCFHHFGDRVKTWLTFNEPWCISVLGFCTGEHAPGRTGQPWKEPYIAAHNIIKSHAYAARLYRQEYKPWQKGRIGITMNCDWREPLPDQDPNRFMRNCEAAERTLQFFLGWFADPIFLGDYPQLMKVRLGSRLPVFTDEEKAVIKDSADFFGLNHYTTTYVEDVQPGMGVAFSKPEEKADWVMISDGAENGKSAVRSGTKENGANAKNASQWGVKSLLSWVQGTREGEEKKAEDVKKSAAPKDNNPSVGWFADQGARWSYDPSWERTDLGWAIVPWGIRKQLAWIQRRYHPAGGIYVTENGCAVKETDVATAICDSMRVQYLQGYISEVHSAITQEGVDCRGYFVWSLLDNFEWAYGYTKRFGICWMNYDTMERVPKESSKWYSKVVATNTLVLEP